MRGVHGVATDVDPDRPVRIDRYLEGVEVDVDAISDGRLVLIPGLLEHVELAGVHSGDSVGMFPPQTVSEGDQALIVATMERIALALGAKGLVNAQFIVRDDGVYLIENGKVTAAVNNFRFNESPLDLLRRATAAGLSELTLPREWGDWATRSAMPSLRIPDFHMSSVSQAQ